MNFERNKDPKEALAIGLYQVRHFKDDYKAVDFILPILDSIISKKGDGLTRMQRLEEYVRDYIRVDDGIGYFPQGKVADPSLMFLIRRTLGVNGIRIKEG